MRALLSITKALSDQNRVRILCALSERGELCVCQIHELLQLAPSTTSKHLALLAAAGLVDVRKEGRWAYYRLAESDVPEDAAQVVAWLCARAGKERQIAEDRRRLDQVLSWSPEELCQRQAQGLECCSSAPETPAEARSPKDTPGCCGAT